MGVVNVMLDSTTRLKLDRMLDTLLDEFGGCVDHDRIEQLMSESVEEITAGATVFDFVPLFAYRADARALPLAAVRWQPLASAAA